MKSRQTILVTLFFVATLLVFSWLLLCSFEDFLIVSNKGIDRDTIQKLPEIIRPLYAGQPNSIILLCYILYTLTAFLLVKEKKKKFKTLSIVSFVMVFWLLYYLF